MLVPTLARQIMGWERRPALKSKWKSSVSALDTQKKTLFHYARGKEGRFREESHTRCGVQVGSPFGQSWQE